MPWAPDQNGQWQYYASPLLEPSVMGLSQGSWNPDPTGTGPTQGDPNAPNYGQQITTHYNPMYSATDETAQILAKRLGGQVIKAPMREAGGGTPGSTFNMPDVNYIRMPNGAVLNAGETAQWEQQYGTNSPQFQRMVDQETAGGAQDASGGGEGATGGAAYWYKQYGNQPGVTPPQAGPEGTSPPIVEDPKAAKGDAVPSSGGYSGRAGGPGGPRGGGTSVVPGGPAGSGAYPTGNRPPTGGTATQFPPDPGTGGRAGGPVTGNRPPTGGTAPPPPSGTTGTIPPTGGPGRAGGPPTGNRPPTGGTATIPPPSGRGTSLPPTTGGNTGGTTTAPNTSGSGYGSVTNPGGYGIGFPAGMSGGNGAIGPLDSWGFVDSTDPKTVLANDRRFAYGQGQKLTANYGDSMAAQDQRGRQMGSVGDDLYSWMLANPGYTPQQAKDIMNKEGLGALDWTDKMGQDNMLTADETTGIKGDPNRALGTYNNSVEGLREGARNYTHGMKDIYDSGATNLNSANGQMSQRLDDAIDPTQLGLSDTYSSQHQFGPEDQQALIEDAGRTVGQGTKAVTDQLERQAAAAGTNAPLALSAALDRQRQTGAVASADAMTKAKIQARQLGLTTGQEQENTRLGAAEDIASRRTQAATTMGTQNQQNQQFLTAGRANAGLTTGAAELAENNTIAGKQTDLTSAAELQQQQRAQALAQNRQSINQQNQNSQFTRGSYTDQARSQRATQAASAARNDLTSARQDVRNEEGTAYNESNSRMAGQLQGFGATVGAGQASQQNAIIASQLPTSLQKIGAGLVNGAQTPSFGEGGVATEPTMARLGELGPEIVIKLKPSQPMAYRRQREMGNAA